VEITSTVGEGTSVALYIPRAEVPALAGPRPALEEPVEDEAAPRDLGEVLVVDDEVEVALALQGMLQESGYGVRTAVGAEEALEALRTRRPNVVLTDVTMPGTMDGVALAREIRKLHPGLPVVLITGNPTVVAQSSEFPLLQKPIVSRDLHVALQRHLAPVEDDRVVSLFGHGGRRSS
jgi:DNA-binding NtrC family response regulator